MEARAACPVWSLLLWKVVLLPKRIPSKLLYPILHLRTTSDWGVFQEETPTEHPRCFACAPIEVFSIHITKSPSSYEVPRISSDEAVAEVRLNVLLYS